jgi:acyl transferase domain-containing protein
MTRARDENTIAIIGMAGRFPEAPDLDIFWSNLVNGVEAIRRFSEQELSSAGVPRALSQRADYVPARPVLTGIDEFDAEFFGVGRPEAELMDPQQRVFLECAWEALEDAGHDPAAFAGRIGVFAGAAMSTYYAEVVHGRPATNGWPGLFQAITGNEKEYLATRLAYALDLRGPAISVQSACSTSLVAVHTACSSLLARECDMAIAGGVTIRLPHYVGYVYEPRGLFSPDGHCRPFDASARGTVFGSGAGVVVLRRLSDALADGDPIRATILGSSLRR